MHQGRLYLLVETGPEIVAPHGFQHPFADAVVIVFAHQFREITDAAFQVLVFILLASLGGIFCGFLAQGEVEKQFQAVAFCFRVDISVEDDFAANDEDVFVEQAVLGELLPDVIEETAALILQKEFGPGPVFLKPRALFIRDLYKGSLETSAKTYLLLHRMIHYH